MIFPPEKPFYICQLVPCLHPYPILLVVFAIHYCPLAGGHLLRWFASGCLTSYDKMLTVKSRMVMGLKGRWTIGEIPMHQASTLKPLLQQPSKVKMTLNYNVGFYMYDL